MSKQLSEFSLPFFVRPALLLRVEGAVILAVSLFFYAQFGGKWLIFALLLFAPDLSALGFLVNRRIGTIIYNIVHTFVWPALLIAWGLYGVNMLMVLLALIWLAHIGMDRMVGYNLRDALSLQESRKGRR